MQKRNERLTPTPCTTSGWFGLNCQYKCHCARSAPCDKVDGTCSSGCHPDWFGPRCQYALMKFTVHDSSRSGGDWLTDQRDETCNSGTITSVMMTLDTPIPLTWIRLVVNVTDNFKDTILRYQEKGTDTFVLCENLKTAKVDDKTLDVICETNNTVEMLLLQGSVVNKLCSLYISKGRNVALKQPSTQSTLYEDWYASKAVDGLVNDTVDEESQGSTCSHTMPDSRGWWKLTFLRPADIAMFVLYNRRYIYWRLEKFELTVSTDNTSEPAFMFRDPGTSSTTTYVYTVVPPTMICDARQVKIEAARDQNMLTLCEVEVFGEVSCPRGWFGLACESQCNCVNQTGCFVHSGGCTSGCAVGYTGEDCKSKCPIGKYGAGCTETCSPYCSGPGKACNHVDGSCTNGCEDGYTGRKCDEPGDTELNAQRLAVHSVVDQTEHVAMLTETALMVVRKGIQAPGVKNIALPEHMEPAVPAAAILTAQAQIMRVIISLDARCAGPDNACRRANGYCEKGCDQGYKGDKCDSAIPLSAAGSTGRDPVKHDTKGIAATVAAAVVAAILVALAVVGVFTFFRRSFEQSNRDLNQIVQFMARRQSTISEGPEELIFRDNQVHDRRDLGPGSTHLHDPDANISDHFEETSYYETLVKPEK
ncbi:multiple epidermal growth factor-like domains 10 [Elysia marginata]|uniref:Multiple epidermal growth factor-like domains 10 n=1 Tax=Elysia marginata TaxID=1093978 RepID=A0AAV4GSK3_9GAST|nr:multiple epidermal growth factor-like domains 10 [Elysia marginata]